MNWVHLLGCLVTLTPVLILLILTGLTVNRIEIGQLTFWFIKMYIVLIVCYIYLEPQLHLELRQLELLQFRV